MENAWGRNFSDGNNLCPLRRAILVALHKAGHALSVHGLWKRIPDSRKTMEHLEKLILQRELGLLEEDNILQQVGANLYAMSPAVYFDASSSTICQQHVRDISSPPLRGNDLYAFRELGINDALRLRRGVLLPQSSTELMACDFVDLPPKRTSQRQFSPSIRFQVLKRDNYRCRLCGVKASDGPNVRLEVDHITPRSKGGNDDPMNLWVLCFTCTRGKGVQDL